MISPLSSTIQQLDQRPKVQQRDGAHGKVCHWSLLPEEMVKKIFGYLPDQALGSCTMVNRKCSRVAEEILHTRLMGQHLQHTYTYTFPDVTACSLSPDGRRLVAASSEGSIRIFVPDGKEKWKEEGEIISGMSRASHICFSHNGLNIGIACPKAVVLSWQEADKSWKVVYRHQPKDSEYQKHVSFSPDDHNVGFLNNEYLNTLTLNGNNWEQREEVRPSKKMSSIIYPSRLLGSSSYGPGRVLSHSYSPDGQWMTLSSVILFRQRKVENSLKTPSGTQDLRMTDIRPAAPLEIPGSTFIASTANSANSANSADLSLPTGLLKYFTDIYIRKEDKWKNQQTMDSAINACFSSKSPNILATIDYESSTVQIWNLKGDQWSEIDKVKLFDGVIQKRLDPDALICFSPNNRYLAIKLTFSPIPPERRKSPGEEDAIYLVVLTKDGWQKVDAKRAGPPLSNLLAINSIEFTPDSHSLIVAMSTKREKTVNFLEMIKPGPAS